MSAAALLATGCDNEPDEHELPVGDVTSIETAPGEVQVSPTAEQTREFRLYAWYRHDDSIVPGRADQKQWSVIGTDGDVTDGEVTVRKFPLAGSMMAEVLATKADKPSVAGKSQLVLWADPGAAKTKGDVVNAPHKAGLPPSMVLLEERAASGDCKWGKPAAFVGTAAVGEQTINPCSLSLFSADRAMLFHDDLTDPKWPPNAWSAPGTSFPLTPADPLKVRVTVFIAAPQAATAVQDAEEPSTVPSALDLEDLAKTDVDWANILYENNRVGVRLDVKQYVHLDGTPDELAIKIGADPYDCVLPPSLQSNPAESGYAYDPAGISVYYVSRINFPPDLSVARVRGIQCHHWYSGNPLGSPPGNGPVVFVSYGHHSTVTLAHEVGHALGLNDEEGMLGTVNIMHNLLPDGPLGADARSRLKLGQVFRMNVWNDSWINTRLPLPPRRACDASQTCPEKASDVP
jgi:hypothetical protein